MQPQDEIGARRKRKRGAASKEEAAALLGAGKPAAAATLDPGFTDDPKENPNIVKPADQKDPAVIVKDLAAAVNDAEKKQRRTHRARASAQDLPGMEDRKIPALDKAAREYVDIRDQRIALNQQEKPLKENLLALMKKNGKTMYNFDGVEIEIVVEKEKIKVKTTKTVEDEEDEE